tara:strand:- start:164 stop:307 length:144 start_codon:yes stop_codon:yes gene_type:complete
MGKTLNTWTTEAKEDAGDIKTLISVINEIEEILSDIKNRLDELESLK